MKKLTVIIGIVVAGALAAYAEPVARPEGTAPSTNVAAPLMIGPTLIVGTNAQGGEKVYMAIMQKAMDELKQKNPQRYDQISKLQQSNVMRYRMEVRIVMQEYFKNHPDEAPMGIGRPAGGRGDVMRTAMQALKEKDSARYDAIMKLQQSDRKAFYEKMRGVMQEYLKEHPDEAPMGSFGRPSVSRPATPAAPAIPAVSVTNAPAAPVTK